MKISIRGIYSPFYSQYLEFCLSCTRTGVVRALFEDDLDALDHTDQKDAASLSASQPSSKSTTFSAISISKILIAAKSICCRV